MSTATADARTFLEGLGFLPEDAIEFIVDPQHGLGFETVEDLTTCLVQESDLTRTNLSLCLRRKLWFKIQAERKDSQERIAMRAEGVDPVAGSASPLKGIMVQLESNNDIVCNIIRSNIADLTINEEFSENLVTLLTTPSVTDINGIILKGPPFKAVVAQNTNGRVTKAVVEVAEAANKAPFLVVRVLGHHMDGSVDAQLPTDFLHTAPYDPEKIAVSVKHIVTSSSCLSRLRAAADVCPALHLIQLQLLGGTNKALQKIPQSVTQMCIAAIEAKITLNAGDAHFGSRGSLCVHFVR